MFTMSIEAHKRYIASYILHDMQFDLTVEKTSDHHFAHLTLAYSFDFVKFF